MALLKSKLTSDFSITQTKTQLTTIIKLKLKQKLKLNKIYEKDMNLYRRVRRFGKKEKEKRRGLSGDKEGWHFRQPNNYSAKQTAKLNWKC